MTRKVIACFALLALVVQTLVVQTHVHIPAFAQTITAAHEDATLAAAPAKTPPDKYPLHEDPANCPLCQEMHHNGRFLTPAAAALFVPLVLNFRVIVLEEPALLAQALSHLWQSRAPPSRD